MTGRPGLAELDRQLEALLGLPLDARQARLAALDRSDPALAGSLRRLLQIAIDADTFELRRAGERLVVVGDEGAAPDIPGYLVGPVIGRGGMATVWAGRRDVAGTAQTVAIKLLRTGLSSPVDQARFLNEQRILARLRHPSIAVLLDVGVVDDRPYMVLERIVGVPIDQHLAPGSEALPRILDALDDIADALATAHAHLVIHRDIKPANVLVDQDGHVKLIDFGIAKVLDGGEGPGTHRTATAAAPLTLRYASPEQLSGQPVGVASDVYQFGLLTYLLLTGAWPWPDEGHDWPRARLDPDVLPVPPSRRIAEPGYRRRVAGDLDAIVLRCLRYAPHERYQSMAELRDDLARHRSHRPVRARRQTWRYRLVGFLRRHRLGVAVAAGLVALALGGLVSTALLAARSAEHAGRIARVLDTLTTLLTEADPYQGAPGSVTVGQVVDTASDTLLAQRSGDPLFDLALMERLAGLQGELRNTPRQLALLQRAATIAAGELADGQAQARIAAAQVSALVQAGRYEEAEAKLSDFRGRWPGPLPPRLALDLARLDSDRGRLAAADAVLEDLLASVPAGQRLLRYDVLAEKAIVLGRQARYHEALATIQEAGELLDPQDLTQRRLSLRHRANLANALGLAGHQAEAASRLGELGAEHAERLGARHPRVVLLAVNQAQMLALSGRPRQALAALDARGLEPSEVDDPHVRALLGVQRGRAALFAGLPAMVMPAYLDALETAAAAIGPRAPGLAPFVEPLAWALFEFGEEALAADVAWQARAIDPAVTVVADMLLEWLAASQPRAGRPDPDFRGRLHGECNRLEFSALSARLAGDQAALRGQPVPSDCSVPTAMRLAALGLAWSPPDGQDPVEAMDSPLLSRLGGRGHPHDARLTPPQRARIEAWLRAGEAAIEPR